jgi:hypothetical protein
MTGSARTGSTALLFLTAGAVIAVGARAAVSVPPAAQPPAVDFHKDIEPIIKSRCLSCHGPDKRKGGLLLTSRKDALIPADSGRAALVPGDGKNSELLHRVQSARADLRMPPSGPPLSPEQITLLRRWIDEGMQWPQQASAEHWAYVKPVRPPLPAVKKQGWAKNPIDHFILARLEKEQLTPAPPAERERLIRRVFLDLIGLPPSIAQVDAFVKDTRPDAYERVVDELLASPHYGERWARPWLDLARYADSNGFQRDGFRTVWPYRDWVVAAFNRDMPFDQFTVAQIAGDLLPDATVEQKIATGFNRCTTVNVEAGTDREENRVNAVLDRVNTTATVWLGTSMACAQCHNHKYDPFSQTDYYRMFAYFNSTLQETAEGNQAAREFTGPRMTLPMPPADQTRRQEVQAQREPVAATLKEELAKAAPQQAAWEKQTLASKEQLQKLPAEVRKLMNLAPAKRNKKQAQDVSDYFADQQPGLKKLRAALAALDEQLKALEPPTTLVMVELDKPRPTHVFKRGNFLDRGQPVQPGTPAALHALPPGAAANRLALARWLVADDNPLVARVAVNRWWAEFFGHGLVGTPEDFGSQGDPPTHPELLDWLATEFMSPTEGGGQRQRWSMKHVHRLIVTSATYRQSARLPAELARRDPDNKLYARGPRFRLDAEMIRDNALAVSGLLSAKLGGPPVMPPQPAGIWTVTGVVDNTYRTSQGEDRYRRGLYTIWRRSSPYPSFVAFDAPDRAACVVQRPRTNTPLQALTLLNDPVYVEATVALAKRMANRPVSEGKPAVAERVGYGFRLCLARHPSARETELLGALYERALTKYRADPAAARAVLQQPAGGAELDVAQWAAWFQVATVLLNLDETITKG